MANVKITEEEFNSLLKQLEEHAASNGFALNPDQNVVKSVIAGLIRNRQLYGDYFCPCRLRKDLPYVCPCAAHKRDIQKLGKCACGLFIRKDEKNAEENSEEVTEETKEENTEEKGEENAEESSQSEQS